MGLPAIKIDTLAIAKELEASGIPVEQAETQTRVYVKIIDMIIEDQLATKQDLTAVESSLKQEISTLGAELREEMTELKIELRQEMAELKTKLRQEMVELKTELRQEMSSIKQEMIILDHKLSKRMDALENQINTQTLKLTVRLGSLIGVGVLLLAALQKI